MSNDQSIYIEDQLNNTLYDFLTHPRVNNQLNAKVEGSLFSNNVDPCRLSDEQRDELLRQKRKEDAYKTALCETYRKTKECSYGSECRFAHGLDELRLPSQPRGRTHPKYKTVLCDKYTSTGYCKYGARCMFIHRITNQNILRSRENAWKLISARSGNIHPSELPPFIQQSHFDSLNMSLPFIHESLNFTMEAMGNDTFSYFDNNWKND